MIYDCFTFFNELDLLEIRLNTLDDVVDRFVLVEATRTFQNKPKALFFKENQKRYEKFLPKIQHVIVDEYPTFFKRFRKPSPWDFERNQRDHIDKALKDVKPTDILILSDIDEIPRPEKIKEYKDVEGVKVFEQRMYYYFLNLFIKDYEEPIPEWQGYKPWRGTIMLTAKDHSGFEDIRTQRNKESFNKTLVRDGGWHYSWLGGVEGVIAKLKAYAHSEHNSELNQNPGLIQEAIMNGKGLFGHKVVSEIEKDLQNAPEYLKENEQKYSHLFLRSE